MFRVKFNVFWEYSFIMELYSLEEEEGGDMFITQQNKNIVPLIPNFELNGESVMDTNESAQNQVLCQPIYSDISDDDAFKIPCSQVARVTPSDR